MRISGTSSFFFELSIGYDTLGSPAFSPLWPRGGEAGKTRPHKDGMRVATMGDQIDVETPEVLAGPRCASVSGVNVHANVSVAARDRMGLERLCRYAGRPPATP